MDTLFRWSKFIEEGRLEEWETRLLGEGVSYVLDKSTRRRRWTVASYAPTRAEAESLRARYGGSVAPLDPSAWMPVPTARAEAPLRIRDRLLVSGSEDPKVLRAMERSEPGRIVLSFPPQLAFGTGGHATTAGCLRFLADSAKRRGAAPWRMLDLGCGSGILAVAAAKLGAGPVLAVENDPMALGYACENARRHGVGDRVEFLEGDAVALLRKKGPPWDLVAANLFSDLLEEVFPLLPRHLAPDGEAIVSGFLASQAGLVSDAAAAAGLPFRELRRRGKWMAGRCGR